VHEWYTFSLDFHDGREILYGISCPLFAGSTVDVPTHVDGGVAGQFLKFFGRNVSVFNQKVDEGDPGGVEIELALGRGLWDARSGKVTI
jgi:hypothetical protein